MGLPLDPLGTSFDLPTPPAAAFIPYKVSAPTFLTASLVNTNSPGVSIAGTVSVFPWPGTSPPLFILVTLPLSGTIPPLFIFSTSCCSGGVSSGFTCCSFSSVSVSNAVPLVLFS